MNAIDTRSPVRLKPAALPRGAVVTRLVLEASGLAAAGIALAALVWLAIAREPGLTRLPPPAVTTGTGAAPVQLNAADRAALFQRPLFGDVTLAVAGPVEEAAETQLSLEITGLRAGEPGTAILRLPNNREVTVAEGEEIMAGVTLLDVRQASILLSRNGVRERLDWERETAFLPARGGTQQGEAAPMTGATPATTAPARSVASLAALLGDVSLSPARDDDEFEGYRITPDTPGALAGTGLEPGDVIVSVNGVTARDPLSLDELLGAASGANAARLTVLRADVPQEVVIPLTGSAG